jgi:antitoxin (DNA-binding transcriptional repressor) of toxin-antitoxin stability system
MRPLRVNIEQAKDQLADLVAAVAKGNEVVIVEDEKPLARLIPPDGRAYQSLPASAFEFSSDEESLAWDANGWENVT